ncbi:MAG TPA: hypothetical protein DIV86_07535 [Alphaproteobacteria bacterium]|nr:hypothetical protein [Alphaproteobacteria bacterium]
MFGNDGSNGKPKTEGLLSKVNKDLKSAYWGADYILAELKTKHPNQTQMIKAVETYMNGILDQATYIDGMGELIRRSKEQTTITVKTTDGKSHTGLAGDTLVFAVGLSEVQAANQNLKSQINNNLGKLDITGRLAYQEGSNPDVKNLADIGSSLDFKTAKPSLTTDEPNNETGSPVKKKGFSPS